MTALTKYQRLEGSGLWRADPQQQRRDVVVALGDASLTITDARSGAVLSHWSLPAVQRVNPGRMPALFTPSSLAGAQAGPEDEGETLELDDETLIGALETIRAALAPRHVAQRLRRALAAVAIVAMVALGVFWLPGALVNHVAGIVPPAKRAQIGREALEDLTATAQGVRLCADPAGRQALATLRNRVLGAGPRVMVVAGLEGFEAAHLPGRLVIVSSALLERLDSPEALAGYLIAEDLAGAARDPLRDLLHHAGLRATFALLTTGNLPRSALAGYAGHRLARPPALPEPAALAARLEALGISPSAYAVALSDHGAALAEALADQPAGTARAAQRLLSDGEWITMQNICQN
ncbi:MAG: hypothetical protein ACK4LQ_03765 [Pararhodobacter sp.]